MKFLRRLFRFLLRTIMWFFLSTIVVVILYRFIPVPVTPLMVIRVFEQAGDDKREVKLYKDWEPLSRISPSLPIAVIASEDQRFQEHFGFDFEAIQKARKFNERTKSKRIKGASTISQQTAKNVFLWPDRSWFRKGLEVYFTLLIEIFWSKERIMEVYLNVIEMGEGVYGAEAASQTYFKKKAEKLTKSESALIAACLPNPIRWSPKRPTAYIRKKQAWIIRQMGYMSKPEWQIKTN